MMPFITDMPNKAMNPMAAETLNGTPVRQRPMMPPMTAIGITLMASSVSPKEPKLIHNNSAISPSVTGTTICNLAIAS